MQLSVLEERNQPVMERYQQVWTPTIVLIYPDGRAFYEWNGYLPPTHYLGHLLLGRGKGALKRHRHEEAARLFDAAAAQDPCDGVGPEARYWGSVARYKGSGKPDDLLGGWQRLRQEYPDSEWRVRQSFTEQ